MNRIFHARIATGQYLFLLIATVVTIHQMWVKHVLIALLFMLLLIVVIERLIHTTYTITSDGRLVLHYGRFSRSKEIALKDITDVRRASGMRVGGFAVMRHVLVSYGDKGKCVMLLPVKEDEFIKMLQRRFPTHSA